MPDNSSSFFNTFSDFARTKAHSSTETSVATPSLAYQEMLIDWELPIALWGGTRSMRHYGQQYLPKEPKESETAYQNRLKRTFLLNIYKKTIKTISGLAFLKPVTVTGVPERLKYLEHNADGTGRSITEVAHQMVEDGLNLGKSHALVDFPKMDSQSMSLGQLREKDPKPFISVISSRDLIGWKTNSDANFPSLTQIRFYATSVVPSEINVWSDKEIHFVYVMENNQTNIYRFDSEIGDEFQFVETIENSLGDIPLVTAYANKTGFMKSQPPLLDLAWKNLEHYQSSSDQRHILHVARVPFMLATGFPEDELENAEIGPNRIISTSDPDANIKYVEHTGQAIRSGENDIEKLEQQMSMLGADLLISKGADRQTATARKIDQSESLSTLQLVIRSVEKALENAYELAGQWLGVDTEGIEVSIGDELGIANEPNPTNALVTLLNTGLITDQQAVDEAKRQGILSSYFELSEERPSVNKPTNMSDEELSEMIRQADQEKEQEENSEQDEEEDKENEEDENN